MKDYLKGTIIRRDLFRYALAGTGLALIGSPLSKEALAHPVDLKNKRRSRYQGDSPEVRNFYRVNSYPDR
ncbi:formate dehydrogenase [uncultured Bradyrhizobium sp.]|uniref:formate dehydrogenase n=1 Tax=uncultured Bradyrhizobium sp. TaxID=199684 RepID=UPI00261B5874|nr:formate dehydrogenase [uncultured Bradyrhizobium sp.]